jgi:vacuolar-type H+-ATPase subunit E/Vma4
VSLESLRAAFLETVSAEIAEAGRALEAERGRRMAIASAAAERLVADARVAAESAAANEARQLVAQARRQARGEILAARRDTYDELRAAALSHTLSLRGSPRYRELLDRLVAEVRSELGTSATIAVDPDPAGGVIARDGTRLVDCSLPALAGRCLTALGPRVEELWR